MLGSEPSLPLESAARANSVCTSVYTHTFVAMPPNLKERTLPLIHLLQQSTSLNDNFHIDKRSCKFILAFILSGEFTIEKQNLPNFSQFFVKRTLAIIGPLNHMWSWKVGKWRMEVKLIVEDGIQERSNIRWCYMWVWGASELTKIVDDTWVGEDGKFKKINKQKER